MDDRRSVAKARRPVLDGSIGRLTYTPARPDNESIGQLRRNRANDEAPHFKQVTPFTPWCGHLRNTGTHLNDMRPAQIARSQEYWLLEYLPEAAVSDAGFESLLLEELSVSEPKRPKKSPTLTTPGSLFSTGEIIDQRNADGGAKGHLVLAITSGVAGNVLRLISLTREEWGWNEADIRVRVHAADSQLEGEWCQDGLPISQLKFAIDSRKHDPIRWLLVQNGTSSVVYAPEVREIPMPPNGAKAPASRIVPASQIFANPVFTIPCERTGGNLQTDVCFGRCAETDTPQLAIIDQGGYWSLWDIPGRRNAQGGKLKPILKMCGNTVLGSLPMLPSGSAIDPLPHAALFLSLGQGKAQPLSREGSPAEHSQRPETDHSDHSRRVLLLGNPTAIHLLDMNSGVIHSVSHLLLSDRTHRILGAAPSRLDPSQAFILTSTTLFWVASRKGKNDRKGKKDTLTLDILASCPHQRDINDPTLRMDVSPGAYINDLVACFVCIRSSKNTEVTTFWFINPPPGTPVRYHRELVSLRAPSNFIGLAILPAGRRVGEAEPASAAGRAMRNAQLRFFQLLTLGTDLDVHGALCAWTDAPGVSVGPPDFKKSLVDDDGSRRTKLLQNFTSAFVVPDEFDERAVFGRAGVKKRPRHTLKGGIEPRVDLTLAAQRLATVQDSAVGVVKGEGGDEFGFIDQAIERGREDGYMPRQSLLDLATSQGVAEEDLLQLAREWDARQEALHRQAGEWVFVPEARRPVINFGPDDLVERLRDMYSDLQLNGKLPSDKNRDAVLEKMAAELFLSSIGISSVPETWTTATLGGPLSSSFPFPSSPTLMPSSSQPGFGSSSKLSQLTKSGKAEEATEEEKGDPVTLRLRKYATLNTSAKFSTGEQPVLALSRWELGEDPDSTEWIPGQDLEAEQAINRRRKKIEARRRKAERLSQRIFGESGVSFGSSFGGGRGSLGGGRGSFGPGMLLDSSQQQQQLEPSSQITMPTILSTSQPQQSQSQPPWEFSSQVPPMASPTRRVRVGSPLRREVRRESAGRRESGGGVGVFGQARSQGLGLGIGSSQSQLQSQSQGQGMSQGTPSQARSQVMPGLFGGRVSLSPFKKSPVKRVKRKSELRLSGFR